MTRGALLPLVLFAALALAPVLALLGVQAYWLSLLTRVMITAIAALSLHLMLGAGGLVSFGHAAFVAIGAYAVAAMAEAGLSDALLVVPAAMAASAAFAAATGAVALRTKGVAYIMITLAFGQMIYFLAQSLYAFGGDDGYSLPARSTLAGFAPFKDRLAFYYVTLATLAATYACLSVLLTSRFGRALRASRDNPVRVASQGFDVQRVRLAACVIAGALASVSGVLLANHAEFVSPAYAAWQRSGELLFMLILGGVGSPLGAIVGAFAFLLAEEFLSGLTEHWKMVFGPLVVAFVIFTNGGLTGMVAGRRDG